MARRLTTATPNRHAPQPGRTRSKLADARRRRFLIVGLVVIVVWFLALVAGGVGASQPDATAPGHPTTVTLSA